MQADARWETRTATDSDDDDADADDERDVEHDGNDALETDTDAEAAEPAAGMGPGSGLGPRSGPGLSVRTGRDGEDATFMREYGAAMASQLGGTKLAESFERSRMDDAGARAALGGKRKPFAVCLDKINS